MGAITHRAPSRFNTAPKPDKAWTGQLNLNGLNKGRVTVLVYPTTELRDQAYAAVVNNEQTVQLDVVIGEKNVVVAGGLRELPNGNGFSAVLNSYVTWARCGAVGHIELANPPRDPLAYTTQTRQQVAYMRLLDARLAALLCKP